MGTAIEVNHVWKKFYRGEFNNSLRDAVPAMLKSLVGLGPSRTELQKGDFWALKDVNFKVEEGESVALIGHNGAGKSTLLKIFSKILKPNRGNIKVNGRMRALIEIGSGFHGDLTGRENIFLNGSILGMSRKEIQSKFDAIVDFAGIEEFLDMPVKRYSSGMYARLGFAVAAHLEPEILIVDEVLAVGDMAFQRKCLRKMNEVAHEGRTVLFVSHNMTAVKNLCHRALLFDHGVVLEDGEADKIVDDFFILLKKNNLELESTLRHQENQRAIITQVLCGSNERVLSSESTCHCNSEIIFRVHYQVNHPIENAIITVVVIDYQETHLVGFSTRVTEKKLGPIGCGEYYIDFKVPNFPLPQNPYTVAASIFDGTERLDYINDAAKLNIEYLKIPGWDFASGYYQKCFTPFTWENH
jgi:ABC-type polysaccharide/polyol phosphate transport system ATPase subunit